MASPCLIDISPSPYLLPRMANSLRLSEPEKVTTLKVFISYLFSKYEVNILLGRTLSYGKVRAIDLISRVYRTQRLV